MTGFEVETVEIPNHGVSVTIWSVNKSDLGLISSLEDIKQTIEFDRLGTTRSQQEKAIFAISALTGEGIEEVMNWMGPRMRKLHPGLNPPFSIWNWLGWKTLY